MNINGSRNGGSKFYSYSELDIAKGAHFDAINLDWISLRGKFRFTLSQCWWINSRICTSWSIEWFHSIYTRLHSQSLSIKWWSCWCASYQTQTNIFRPVADGWVCGWTSAAHKICSCRILISLFGFCKFQNCRAYMNSACLNGFKIQSVRKRIGHDFFFLQFPSWSRVCRYIELNDGMSTHFHQ